jgi:hypothetical protein
MFKSAEEDRAFVEECLWFPCSLDSGALTCTIPQKLLRKLRDRGVSLEGNKLDETMQIDQAFAGSTCTAESSSHLTLRLHTRVGPVLFRGTRNRSSLGRDLLKTSPELDVSGIPSIFSESGMKSMSFGQGRDQHTIQTEGSYSHTLPNHLTTTVTTASTQIRIL